MKKSSFRDSLPWFSWKLHILARLEVFYFWLILAQYNINLQNMITNPEEIEDIFIIVLKPTWDISSWNIWTKRHSTMIWSCCLLQAFYKLILVDPTLLVKFTILKIKIHQNGMAISLGAWMIILILLKYFNTMNLIKVVLIIPFLCPTSSSAFTNPRLLFS